ncbi:hypothetical protein SLA2020_510350 [Shorea laevis]
MVETQKKSCNSKSEFKSTDPTSLGLSSSIDAPKLTKLLATKPYTQTQHESSPSTEPLPTDFLQVVRLAILQSRNFSPSRQALL